MGATYFLHTDIIRCKKKQYMAGRHEKPRGGISVPLSSGQRCRHAPRQRCRGRQRHHVIGTPTEGQPHHVPGWRTKYLLKFRGRQYTTVVGTCQCGALPDHDTRTKLGHRTKGNCTKLKPCTTRYYTKLGARTKGDALNSGPALKGTALTRGLDCSNS